MQLIGLTRLLPTREVKLELYAWPRWEYFKLPLFIPDSGVNDTSSLEKEITAVVTCKFEIQK